MGVENPTVTPAGVEYLTSVAIFLKYANKLRFYTQKIRHEIGGVGLPRRILGSNVVVFDYHCHFYKLNKTSFIPLL